MRQFAITVLLVWTAASIAAFFYSQQQNIPRAMLYGLLPAFLLEAGLYLMPGFETVRKSFDRVGTKPIRSLLLFLSAVGPYLIASFNTSTLSLKSFVVLAAVTAVAAFWYTALKPGPVVDILFLAYMGAVFLSKCFNWIYVRPMPHLQLEFLGHLMWIRLGIMAVLSLRRVDNMRFGFLPTSSEWRIGIEQFIYFIPIGTLAAYLLRFARFHPLPLVWWKFALFVPAMFFGVLWVVALSEEFFFRGFLQQLMARGLRSETAGLIAASAIFGCAHLPYHAFPNWRFAIIAAITGVFYGISFLRSRSIRASMVTHALVVTAWRSLFAG